MVLTEVDPRPVIIALQDCTCASKSQFGDTGIKIPQYPG
jgi:hypothetical protein